MEQVGLRRMIGDLRRMIMVNLAGCRDRFRYAGRTERNTTTARAAGRSARAGQEMRRQGTAARSSSGPNQMDVDTDMLIVALLRTGCTERPAGRAVVYRRDRELQQVRELGERVSALAGTGDLATRLVPDAGEGSAAESPRASTTCSSACARARAPAPSAKSVMRRLLESMHEAMAVDRNGIVLANARFAELCGACESRRPARAARSPSSSIRISPSCSRVTCGGIAPASPRLRGSKSSSRHSTGTRRASSSRSRT